MQRIAFALLVSFGLAGAASAALPGDSALGKKVHEANCYGCHDTRVYTGKDHRVNSLEALQAQLNACSHATKKQFSPAEQQSLVKYLNEEFYKFK